MQGTILGNGILRGEDGNRYCFAIESIENLNNRTMEDLESLQVDFEPQENYQATSLFILNNKQESNTQILLHFLVNANLLMWDSNQSLIVAVFWGLSIKIQKVQLRTLWVESLMLAEISKVLLVLSYKETKTLKWEIKSLHLM